MDAFCIMSNKHDAYITLRDAGMLSQSLLGSAVIFEELAVAHISRAVEELDTRLLRVTLRLGEQAWHLLLLDLRDHPSL